MVSLENPDCERFPRLREALAAAYKSPRADPLESPAVHSLLHSLLSMRHLPAEQRQAWGRIFEYFRFDPRQDPAAHIPAARRGVLGPICAQQAALVRQMLGFRED